MSTKKPILSVVLTAFGLLGLASADPADLQSAEPSSGNPPATAPEGTGDAEPEGALAAGSAGVILLTDGQVIQGTIVRDEMGCLLKTPFGSKRFPTRRIEQTFRTMREVYEYKVSQFPEEDTQERLKLAQWCLAQNLQEEAKSQLNGILAINPKHPPAKAMLEKIELAEARKMQRQYDPGVQQAKATLDDMTEAGPKELDPAALSRSRTKSMTSGIADVPEIFNLPRPTALKITEEFGRSVHPVLQAYCAKCHNDRYPGDFQLRQVRSKRDLNRDTLNLNLEATLQLIDPSNPSKSEILSSSLRPHGLGKSKRPIFRGSNDPAYQRLSQWVTTVCKPLNMDAVRQASARSGSGNDEERFAIDRALNLGEAVQPSSARPSGRKNAPEGPDLQGMKRAVPPPRPRQQAGTGPNEFPLVNLENATSLRTTGTVHIPVETVSPKGAGKVDAASPAAKAPAAIPADTGTEQLPELPPEADLSPSTAKTPKKAVKFDPALLERALKVRNGGN